jgi:hypothetical protein
VFQLRFCCFCHKLQEQNTVPSLRKALKDVAMEKDAAVVARVQTVYTMFFCPFVLLVCFVCFHSLPTKSRILV